MVYIVGKFVGLTAILLAQVFCPQQNQTTPSSTDSSNRTLQPNLVTNPPQVVQQLRLLHLVENHLVESDLLEEAVDEADLGGGWSWGLVEVR